MPRTKKNSKSPPQTKPQAKPQVKPKQTKRLKLKTDQNPSLLSENS